MSFSQPLFSKSGQASQTSPESPRLSSSLSPQAAHNFRVILGELETRSTLGLAAGTQSPPGEEIGRYLRGLKSSFPAEDEYVDKLLDACGAPLPLRPLMVAMPVAAFGGQEPQCVERFLRNLSGDAAVRSGAVGVVVFANRPEGTAGDKTATLFRAAALKYAVPLVVLEGAVPRALGRTESPLLEGQKGEGSGRAPIAFIRDVLNIAIMKSWARTDSLTSPPPAVPLVVQMDTDFEGFGRGGLAEVQERFRRDPSCQFLQATSSFDDAHFPTETLPQLALGDRLMRELPLVLKRAFGRPELPPPSQIELYFGEVIQRGIQVAQVERLESVARKGGYGLVRMPEDELDANVRLAWLSGGPQAVQCSEETVFKWNSRRAILAYEQFQAPPISQWTVKFTADDAARREEGVASSAARIHARLTRGMMPEADAAEVINRTLARFPLPKELPGVYANPTEILLEVLGRCGLDETHFELELKNDSSGRVIASLARFSPSEVFLRGCVGH